MSDNSMNIYVADELQNKVKHLHSAIEQAQEIISVLESENNRIRALFGMIVGDDSLLTDTHIDSLYDAELSK